MYAHVRNPRYVTKILNPIVCVPQRLHCSLITTYRTYIKFEDISVCVHVQLEMASWCDVVTDTLIFGG